MATGRTMVQIDTIVTLRETKCSHCRIAGRSGENRETVSKCAGPLRSHACTWFPRFAWEPAAGTLRVAISGKQVFPEHADAKRRPVAFPREAWERDLEILRSRDLEATEFENALYPPRSRQTSFSRFRT